jgi:hypothetical protein
MISNSSLNKLIIQTITKYHLTMWGVLTSEEVISFTGEIIINNNILYHNTYKGNHPFEPKMVNTEIYPLCLIKEFYFKHDGLWDFNYYNKQGILNSEYIHNKLIRIIKNYKEVNKVKLQKGLNDEMIINIYTTVKPTSKLKQKINDRCRNIWEKNSYVDGDFEDYFTIHIIDDSFYINESIEDSINLINDTLHKIKTY